jgi:muramoyltetrapeptide carboxypeptidase
MISYPFLKKGATIGVTAPSSGVPTQFHEVLRLACSRMEQRGFTVVCGETVWTQTKAKSAPALRRAAEFNAMMRDNEIDIIIPPWGGELLIEDLEHIDFENINNKWVLGYSDVSALLLAITLKTIKSSLDLSKVIGLRS